MHEVKEIRGKGEEVVTIKIPPVEEWSLKELKYCCRKKVKGYTRMSREQLIIEVKRILNEKRRQG